MFEAYKEKIEKEFRDLAAGLYHNDQLQIAHPALGAIGFVNPKQGFRLCGLSQTTWNNILKDAFKAKSVPEKFFKKAEQEFLCELGAITTWDGVFNARMQVLTTVSGSDTLGYKDSQTTVADQWSCFARSTGTPPAASYTAVTGGAVMNAASTGAWPLKVPNGANKKYLLTAGAHIYTGTNSVLLVDLLVAAGNISTNTTASTTVNTTALTRYSPGVGVYGTLEVTTQLGGSASNVSVTYTNSSSVGGHGSGSLPMTTSCAVYRLQPSVVTTALTLSTRWPMTQGDVGIKTVDSIQFSAAMGAGVVAVLLYKPLVYIPTLSNLYFTTRSLGAMSNGIIELVKGTDSQMGFLTFFVLASTTLTDRQSYFIRTCEG